MIRPSITPADPRLCGRLLSATYGCVLLIAFCASAVPAASQAITIDTRTGNVSTTGSTVDRRFAQITPTNVELPKTSLDAKTRLELIRILQSEQGFAMRPFPRGHKGLSLEANGKLNPAGEPYLDMVTQFGLCAKPGDAVVLTDIKFDHNKIVFMINGGPDMKHRFLRHIQIGAGGAMNPIVQGGDDGQPTGARLTLEFKGGVPAMTASQVKALLAPLISFDVKTPVQAFTDTLPPKLKEAILSHQVWVGMSTDMVLFAKGMPQRKVREVEGQMPFEEWIYGQPPQPVEFVRINGNRVIRVEIAKVGETPQVFEKDVVEGLMRTDGSPAVPAQQQATRTVEMGDVQRDPNRQAPAPPPTLTAPGEQLPDAARNAAGQMKPVQFPKQKPDDYPDVAAARRADEAKAAETAEKEKDKSGTTGDSAKPADKPATNGSPSLAPPATSPPATDQQR
jgi:hypothetical protein